MNKKGNKRLNINVHEHKYKVTIICSVICVLFSTLSAFLGDTAIKPYDKIIIDALSIVLIILGIDILKSVLIKKSSKNDSTYRKYLLKELELDSQEKTNEKEKNADNQQYIKKENKSSESNIFERTDKKDIIALMLKNNDEITEYFTISKSQAKSSYRFSIISCIVGILMLVITIYGVFAIKSLSLTIIGIVSATITEIISGTVLWIHNKSALQLNHYYNALHENEKFLSAVNLSDKLSAEKKEEMYIEIIKKQIEIDKNE